MTSKYEYVRFKYLQVVTSNPNKLNALKQSNKIYRPEAAVGGSTSMV